MIWSALPQAVRMITRPVAAKDYWSKGLVRRYFANQLFHAILIDREGRELGQVAAIERVARAEIVHDLYHALRVGVHLAHPAAPVALRVLDGAVAVFCAVGGVEPQSETVWRQATKYHVPRIAFINKMDRTGAEFEKNVQQMRDQLGANAVPIQIPLGLEEKHRGIIDLVEMKAYVFHDESLGAKFDTQEIPAEYLDFAPEDRHKTYPGKTLWLYTKGVAEASGSRIDGRGVPRGDPAGVTHSRTLSLGGAYAAQGALAGMLGATALGLVASAWGGAPRLITAPCAPAAAVLAALVLQPNSHAADATNKIRVLIVTGDDVTPAHNWAEVSQAIKEALVAAGR